MLPYGYHHLSTLLAGNRAALSSVFDLETAALERQVRHTGLEHKRLESRKWWEHRYLSIRYNLHLGLGGRLRPLLRFRNESSDQSNPWHGIRADGRAGCLTEAKLANGLGSPYLCQMTPQASTTSLGSGISNCITTSPPRYSYNPITTFFTGPAS